MKKAKRIIALQASPQLNRENLYIFKKHIMNDLLDEHMFLQQYEFKTPSQQSALNNADEEIIRNHFFTDGLLNAIIGSSDFAKSFITSEYLFRSLNENLSIDYTAVATGYLKSVEQLLYLVYYSAFAGKKRMKYWKPTSKDKAVSTDIRVDPYNANYKQKLDFYPRLPIHKAPTFRELVNFIRYYDSIWRVSEGGKEYIVACLNDFCSCCRNYYFHKINIDSSGYQTIVKIRKNAIICLCYIIGGFKLLDSTKSYDEQLGILDYSFEEFCDNITHARFLKIKTKDGYEGVVDSSIRRIIYEYADDGRVINPICELVKIDKLIESSDGLVYECNREKRNETLKSVEYLDKNTIIITRNNIPVSFKKIRLRNKRS